MTSTLTLSEIFDEAVELCIAADRLDLLDELLRETLEILRSAARAPRPAEREAA